MLLFFKKFISEKVNSKLFLLLSCFIFLSLKTEFSPEFVSHFVSNLELVKFIFLLFLFVFLIKKTFCLLDFLAEFGFLLGIRAWNGFVLLTTFLSSFLSFIFFSIFFEYIINGVDGCFWCLIRGRFKFIFIIFFIGFVFLGHNGILFFFYFGFDFTFI